METREELLKELARYETKEGEIIPPSAAAEYEKVYNSTAYPIYDDEQIKQILNAPTQEQLKCPYCHGGRKAKPIVETPSDFLAFDKNGIVAFGNDGSVTTGEDYTKFRYCPRCGRKLGD